MKAVVCLVASVLIMSGQALAQEPLEKLGTQAEQPSGDKGPTTDKAPGAGQQAGSPATIVFTELNEVEDDDKLVKPWGVPVDAVEEMDVFDASGKKIGEVDSILQNKDGEIQAVVVEYGGFLGFGEREAIITLDQLQLKDGNLVTTVTEEDLPEQPEWTK